MSPSDPKETVAPSPAVVLRRDLPFEGLKMLRPKKAVDYKWIAAIGFGLRRLGGVGNSQEEAAIAALVQVLASVEELFAKGVQYRAVEPQTLVRVRELVGRFSRELVELHKVVIDEHHWNTLWEEEIQPQERPRDTSLDINESDVDEADLL